MCSTNDCPPVLRAGRGTMLVAGALAAAVSCNQPGSAPPESGTTRPTAANTRLFGPGQTLSLHLFAARDTFARSDSVRLAYVMRNGGPPRQVRLDSRFFEVRVLDSTNAPLTSRANTWHGSLGTTADLLLPTGGLVGRSFDLACVQLGAEDVRNCGSQVAIMVPGRYTAVVSYATVPPPGSDSGQAVRLQSDTARFVVLR